MRSRSAIRTKHDATTLRQHTQRRICERCSPGHCVAVPPDVGDRGSDARQSQRAVRRRIHRAAGNAYARHRLRSSGGERRRARDPVGADTRASPRRACPHSVAALAVPNLTAILGTIADRFFGAPSQTVRIGRRDWHERQDDDGARHRDGVAAARHALPRTRARSASAASRRCRPATHTTPDCHHGASSARRTARRRRALSRRWKCRRTRSTSIASTACASIPPCSPISRAITWTITARSRAMARRRRKLFAWPELQHAVINADDAFGRTLLATARRLPT